MKKRPIFFSVSCGVGMESTCVYDCAEMTTQEIEDMVWDLAIQCAESFGSYYGEDFEAAEEECDDMFGGDRNFTSDDLDCFWEDYDPEKHDELRAGGGSFKDDF